MARRSVAALDLGWGPTHSEVRLTAAGASFIEVNPRLAGGNIPELVRLASGLDLITATVRVATGLDPELQPRCRRAAVIRFITSPQQGVLRRVTGLQEARGVAGVEEVQLYRYIGARVEHTGDFRDRLGYVIASGETLSSAQEAVELACSRLQVIVS